MSFVSNWVWASSALSQPWHHQGVWLLPLKPPAPEDVCGSMSACFQLQQWGSNLNVVEAKRPAPRYYSQSNRSLTGRSQAPSDVSMRMGNKQQDLSSTQNYRYACKCWRLKKSRVLLLTGGIMICNRAASVGASFKHLIYVGSFRRVIWWLYFFKLR